MNYYFLLEDEKSSIKVLPKWLEYMNFAAERVVDISEVKTNHYVMQSGQGVTQLITRVLYQTFDTIIQYHNVIDELIVVLDSENESVNDRVKQVREKIKEYEAEKDIELEFKISMFVCNHCFESWLLGNASLYPELPPPENNDFYPYYIAYDVRNYDPEEMTPSTTSNETIAQYHFHYLHEECRYNRIRYNKKNPMALATKEYFNELVKRITSSTDLQSFHEFYTYFMNQTTT